MTQKRTEPRKVEADISFLAPGSFINRRFVAPGAEVNTGRYEPHRVSIHDGRSIADRFTLDVQGFVLASMPSGIRDFHDSCEVDAAYPDECLRIVKELTGADLVTGRGWMIRTSGELAERQHEVVDYRHQGGVQPPAAEAHVDFSPDRAEIMAAQIYRDAFPDSPPYKRFISSSLWRCLSPAPQDWPLALCDGSTVRRNEGVKNALVIVDEIPNEATMLGELTDEDAAITASVFHYNPEFRWWYFSKMTPDEVILLKFHDSDLSSVMRVPHTAFHDTSFADAKPRESIEFRSFAFFL
jgi:hypothetical protein